MGILDFLKKKKPPVQPNVEKRALVDGKEVELKTGKSPDPPEYFKYLSVIKKKYILWKMKWSDMRLHCKVS